LERKQSFKIAESTTCKDILTLGIRGFDNVTDSRGLLYLPSGGVILAFLGKSTSCLVSLWEEPEKQKRIEDHYKSRFGKINNVG